jgi:hypothetical protein
MASVSAPATLLLDTVVVILSWRYRLGDEGFDLIGALRQLAARGHERLALDLLSLEELFAIARMLGTPRFAVAPATLDELYGVRDAGAGVIRWAVDLASFEAPFEEWPFDGTSVRDAAQRAPHAAIPPAGVTRMKVDALLTCDYRLIHRREAGLHRQLRPLTPFEVEDWILGCRQPPWKHREACRPRLSRLALLGKERRGLRLGDEFGAGDEVVRAAK